MTSSPEFRNMELSFITTAMIMEFGDMIFIEKKNRVFGLTFLIIE